MLKDFILSRSMMSLWLWIQWFLRLTFDQQSGEVRSARKAPAFAFNRWLDLLLRSLRPERMLGKLPVLAGTNKRKKQPNGRLANGGWSFRSLVPQFVLHVESRTNTNTTITTCLLGDISVESWKPQNKFPAVESTPESFTDDWLHETKLHWTRAECVIEETWPQLWSCCEGFDIKAPCNKLATNNWNVANTKLKNSVSTFTSWVFLLRFTRSSGRSADLYQCGSLHKSIKPNSCVVSIRKLLRFFVNLTTQPIFVHSMAEAWPWKLRRLSEYTWATGLSTPQLRSCPCRTQWNFATVSALIN